VDAPPDEVPVGWREPLIFVPSPLVETVRVLCFPNSL
jgi:hypothetical protein